MLKIQQKEGKKRDDKGNDDEKGGTTNREKDDAKGLGIGHEEDSEEIKTEMELSSEHQSSSESSESEKKDESRRGSAQSHANVEGVSPGVKGKYGFAGLGGAKSGGLGGGRLLNVNVGASTIETAEKFKQRDQELFK